MLQVFFPYNTYNVSWVGIYLHVFPRKQLPQSCKIVKQFSLPHGTCWCVLAQNTKHLILRITREAKENLTLFVCLFVPKARTNKEKKTALSYYYPTLLVCALKKLISKREHTHQRTLNKIACQRAFVGCEPLFFIYCIYLSSTEGTERKNRPTPTIVAMFVTVAFGFVVAAVVIWWRLGGQKTKEEDVALLDSGLYE